MIEQYQTIAAQLLECARYLAGQCDGAQNRDGTGFNKTDADWGRMVAAADVPYWTPTMVSEAYPRLRKYTAQLRAGGIEFQTIQEPLPLYDQSQKAVIRVAKIQNQEIILLWNYHDPQFEEIKAAVKALPTRFYRGNGDGWAVPGTDWTLLQPILMTYQFAINGDPAILIPSPSPVMPVQAVPFTPPTQTRRAELHGQQICVFWVSKDPQFVEIKDAIKALPGRKWNGDVKRWEVPQGSLDGLLPLLKQYEFFVDEKILALVEQRLARHAKSAAAQSDFQVHGLTGTPYPFQIAGIEYAVQAKKCLIADQMGLGKTIQSIGTVTTIGSFPVIVVVPATLKYNWQIEIQTWTPKRRAMIISGEKLCPLPPADYYIINYDILPAWVETLREVKPQAVILDESHKCKNPQAQRSQSALELVEGVEVVLLLTGTPVLNRPNELIHQLKILGRFESLFGTWKNFVTKYCQAYQKQVYMKGGYGATRLVWDTSGASNLEELNRILRQHCFIRRKKADVLKELPEKTYVTIPVELDPEQAKIYAETEKKFAAMADGLNMGDQHDRAVALERITALRQIIGRGKLAAIKSWMEDFAESEEKLVVFAHHIEIQEALSKSLKRGTGVHIFGKDTRKKQQEAVERFQTEAAIKTIVCSDSVAGVGVTLTAASNLIFAEYLWTPADHNQCEDRIHRIGQKDAATITYFQAQGTLDDYMVALLEAKQEVIQHSTDGGEVLAGAESTLKGLVEFLKQKYHQ